MSIPWLRRRRRAAAAYLRAVARYLAGFSGPQITPATYEEKACRYEFWFGSDVTTSLGGGISVYSFRRSARGVDLVPVVNQFSVRARGPC